MVKRYVVTLRSGVTIEVESQKEDGNPIGLWVWSTRQRNPQVLSFKSCSILSTEIAMIHEVMELQMMGVIE